MGGTADRAVESGTPPTGRGPILGGACSHSLAPRSCGQGPAFRTWNHLDRSWWALRTPSRTSRWNPAGCACRPVDGLVVYHASLCAVHSSALDSAGNLGRARRNGDEVLGAALDCPLCLGGRRGLELYFCGAPEWAGGAGRGAGVVDLPRTSPRVRVLRRRESRISCECESTRRGRCASLWGTGSGPLRACAFLLWPGTRRGR